MKFKGTFLAISILAFGSTAFGQEVAMQSHYVFDADALNQVGKQAQQEIQSEVVTKGNDTFLQEAESYYQCGDPGASRRNELIQAYSSEKVVYKTHQLLKDKYGDKIIPELHWVWNNVGGIYGRAAIMYCSFTEYITMFGTSLYQGGFSGRYKSMDVYDIMLSGLMYSHDALSQLSFPQSYLPGQVSFLEKKESRFYNMSPYTYMIDYGRGQIAPSLWQGIIAPAIYVNHDMSSAWTQLKVCGSSLLHNVFHP